MADTLVLGSASPRRSDLLSQLGVHFEVRTVEIDERSLVDANGNIVDSVERIAQAKFAAFSNRNAAKAGRDSSDRDNSNDPTLLITADTLVACEGRILGKPDDDQHLTQMLHEMSGAQLEIATAICLAPVESVPPTQTVTTLVALRDLSDAQIAAYVASGAGLDKAGGLALQGEAGGFIESVNGCWSNVLGLPLCAVQADLAKQQRKRAVVRSCTPGLCGRHETLG